MISAKIVERLLETDALTQLQYGNTSGIYSVHESDLEYLVDTIRQIASDIEVAETLGVNHD